MDWTWVESRSVFLLADNPAGHGAIRSGIGPWCRGTMSASLFTGRIVAVSLVACAGFVTKSAPAAQITENRPVTVDRTAIIDEIAFVGLRPICPEALTRKISSHVGIAFDERMVERDVRTLARLGWFEDVRADVANVESPGFSGYSPQRLHLTFYLSELPFLTNLEFVGSRLLSRQQIDKLLAEKKLKPKLGEPENVVSRQRAAREIASALAELGHPNASVVVRREETAQATVRDRFEIHDGPHVPVGRLTFVGDPEMSSKILRRQMQRIVPGAWFASLRGKDSFTGNGFEDDRERLLAYYQNHGYPNARIGAAKTSQYEENSRRWFACPHKFKKEKLAIAIPVEAGSFYRTASVDVSAALEQATSIGHEVQTGRLRSLANRAYSAQSAENLRRTLEMRVRAKAKKQSKELSGSVEAIRRMDAETLSVRVRFDLSSTPPYTVRRLEFSGMKHFPDRYFRRRIGVKEGVPLDEHGLEGGLARLAPTGFFRPIKREDFPL